MIIDEAEIFVQGGHGGDGCVAFRRERFVPRGGPDGGDGGNGGNVHAIANERIETLLDFGGRQHWRAENGRPGTGKRMFGRYGDDLTIEMPVGTLIHDRDTGVLLKDLSTPGEKICLAQGGKGGRGNVRFARPDHQVPREFDAGTPGQQRFLRLELKLVADVGIVGLPNAGKSTLLSRLSRARPKIAEYPFTTLKPQLGIVELSDHRRFVMADIPGLIEGAHEGAGLGDTFLRHIERTRAILHLVDVGSEFPAMAPEEAYRTIRTELQKYSPALAAKEEIVAASKTDLTDGRLAAAQLAEVIDRDVLSVSGVTGEGVPELAERLWALVQKVKTIPVLEDPPAPPPHREGQ